jgi:hypothetical protein
MKTIARNLNPIGGASSASLDPNPGREESRAKTLALRHRFNMERAVHPCPHGNALYIDDTHRTLLRERSGDHDAPSLFITWTGGKCACDRTVTNSPFLTIPDWDDGYYRYHDKGRCGGCTQYCDGFEGRTLADWMADLGIVLDDIVPPTHPFFARAARVRSHEDIALLQRFFPRFASYNIEHAIASR